MSSSNPNEANNFLQNTIKLKTRTLKPYAKKFVRKGEFRYDVPIQSSIPSGQPTVCYARNAEVPINQQGIAAFCISYWKNCMLYIILNGNCNLYFLQL